MKLTAEIRKIEINTEYDPVYGNVVVEYQIPDSGLGEEADWEELTVVMPIDKANKLEVGKPITLTIDFG